MSTTNGTPPPPRMALSPRDLPRHLVEREQEVAALRDLLLDPERRHAVVIYGMGGVGKTTLAGAIWKDPQVRETFRDGLLWATLGVAPHLGDAQIAWAAMVCDTPLTQAVIAPTTSATTRASLLRAILYNRQYLVVIDDAWDSTDVAGLLLGGPNCAAVITTRIRTVAEDFAPSYMYLDGITSDQALNLLARRLGEPIDDSARADAERLAARLGYMPLALELAAAQVSGRGTSWAELIEMLDADPSGIRLLHQGEPWLHTATIPACFDDSVRILSPDLAQRLFLLGVFAAGRV